MNEHTRDLLQAHEEEIAALDKDIQALCQRRKEIIESRKRLLTQHGAGDNGASNP